MNEPQAATVTVRINKGQKTAAFRQGASLLSGLARNGVYIPSACGGNGRCGYCRVKILSQAGDFSPQEQALLSPEEKTGNIRLSCQVKVTSDLEIEIPQTLLSVKRFSGTVARKTLLTYDILGLKIELKNPKTIDFLPGQYVQVSSRPYDGKDAVLRDFSIASTPSEPGAIELMIRKTPNGIFTTWAFDRLKEGDAVSFSGPYGAFTLSDSSTPALMVAGGSGMAPIWSMLQHIRKKRIDRRICYFFGALTQKDLFLTEELRLMEKEFPSFSFVPALSNEPTGSDWNGERGLITEVVSRRFPDCTDFEAYLCGSPGMINACLQVLKKGGMPENRIFFDKFA
jgi:Na+-transporting NADH:ubiquinone oxidoreductase subunit F